MQPRSTRTFRALAGTVITALAVAALPSGALAAAAAEDEHEARRTLPAYTSAHGSAGDVLLAETGADAPAARLGAAATASIEGLVTGDGAPLAGITVDLWGFSGTQGPDAVLVDHEFTSTHEDGSWSIPEVATGADYWEVMFSDPTGHYATTSWPGVSVYYYPDTIDLDAGSSVQHIDANMLETASIGGTVGGRGFEPEPGSLTVEVVVYDWLWQDWFLTGDVRQVAADGSYQIDGLFPESYRVAAFYSGVRGAGFDLSEELQVAPGQQALWSGMVTLDAVGPDRDFSGDGSPDLLTRTSTGALKLYQGNGAGSWAGSAQVGVGWGSFTALFSAGDFSGDGNPDVLARDTAGNLWLYRGNGTGGWSGASKIGSGWGPFTSILSPGDFDGDGNIDVLARTKAGQLWLYRGNGAGGWLGSGVVGAGFQTFTALLTPGDFDGDGNVDLLARDSAGRLWLYRGNGAGSWLPRAQVGSGWSSFTAIVGAGDFSGDGAPDVFARDAAGKLWLYPGNGSGSWKARSQVGVGWSSLRLVD